MPLINLVRTHPAILAFGCAVALASAALASQPALAQVLQGLGGHIGAQHLELPAQRVIELLATALLTVAATAAAFGAGASKAGFSGLGLVAVVVFASIFGARDSTGVVLPMLVIADVGESLFAAADLHVRHSFEFLYRKA